MNNNKRVELNWFRCGWPWAARGRLVVVLLVVVVVVVVVVVELMPNCCQVSRHWTTRKAALDL